MCLVVEILTTLQLVKLIDFAISTINSMYVYTGFINSFVKVNFNANFTQATCKLIYKIRLNCTFVYESQGDNSQSLITSTLMGTSQTDTVIFNLDTLPNVNYYFTATASSGRDTAVVEGTFTSLRQTGTHVHGFCQL